MLRYRGARLSLLLALPLTLAPFQPASEEPGNLPVVAAGVGTGRAPGTDVSPAAAKLHRQAIVIDTHIDTPQRLLDESFDLAPRDPYGQVDIPRMEEGGLDAGFFSIYADMEKYQGEAATKRALQLIDTVYEQVARHPDQLVLVTTAADIRRAHRQGKIALLMGMEGGTPIADDLGLLRAFYRLGVRYMTLTHSQNNNWADSSGEPKTWAGSSGHQTVHNGLTEFGKEVVREMNRLGMLVDISHVSDKTFYDALEVTQAPVIASHSSCRALVNIPRNMSDDMLRALANNGGVAQINFGCLFVDPDYYPWYLRIREERSRRREEIDRAHANNPQRAAIEKYKLDREYLKQIQRAPLTRLVEHIDYVVRVAGVDHVGLGSDFDGVMCLPQGMEDASYLPRLTQALLERGYKPAEIKKILGGNTLRVMEEAEKVATRLSAKQ